MFFSRIRIKPGSLAQIELLRILQGNVYAVHQLLWKLFPGESEAKRDFLFRQEFEKEQIAFEEETRRGLPLFYMVSQRKPEPVLKLLLVETKEYNPFIKQGMRFTFDLRANPIIAKGIENKKNSVKHDVLMDAKYQSSREGITDKKENGVSP